MNRTESRGWRESAWNRSGAGPRTLGRNGLALEGAVTASRQRRQEESADGSTPASGLVAAPWMGPAQRHYRSANGRVMRMLEWMTAKAWPLSMLDEMCSWFEEGSAASRVFVGCGAAAAMTALLTLHFASLFRLQSMTQLPVFGGHGVLVLVVASFVVGATVLPTVLGQVLGVLLRFYVLVNLCTLAAVVGYGGWLLYSYAKF